MKLEYQNPLITDMQFSELLDFSVAWGRWCSSSLHDLLQSQREIRTIGKVIPVVLCVVLAQDHKMSWGSFALPGFSESWRDWTQVLVQGCGPSLPQIYSRNSVFLSVLAL